MCDASNFAVRALLGQLIDKHFQPIDYDSEALIEVLENYMTIVKELLATVFTFDKFHSYLVLSKVIGNIDHYALVISYPS